MKAIVWTKYGPPDVLQLKEVAKPIPKENEVLIKIRATTITAGDCEMRNLQFPYWIRLPMQMYTGLRKPKRITIPGSYLAGEIEEVGKDVKRLKVSDQVFGISGWGFGTYAEYVCIPENGAVITKPNNITYEEATTVPLGGLEALHFLRKAEVQQGQKVLINGAGGSIGTFGIQLAKYFGTEVTAVDNTGKLDVLRSVGADHLIDYTKEDFTNNRDSYDVIFDVVGKSSFSRCIRSLKQNGRYIIANPSGLTQLVRGLWTSITSHKKVIFEMTNPKHEDLIFLKELIEAGKIKTVIDRIYPLAQIPEAHRYVEAGLKRGNVVISVSENDKI